MSLVVFVLTAFAIVVVVVSEARVPIHVNISVDFVNVVRAIVKQNPKLSPWPVTKDTHNPVNQLIS